MSDKSPYKELSIKEAADILNVSQLFLIELFDQEKISHHKVGGKRRVLLNDLLIFKAKIDKARIQTLEELVEQAQELDMGY